MPSSQTQSWSAVKAQPAIWFILAALVFGIDQLTKNMAQAGLNPGDVHVVTSFFNFQLRFNTGAAFSFLADHGGWQRWLFAVLAAGFSVVLIVWILRSSRKTGKLWELIGLSLILGGALGNLYDRIVLAHVVDFIVWHYQQHEWPAFNIADAAICGGVGCLLLDMILGSKKSDA